LHILQVCLCACSPAGAGEPSHDKEGAALEGKALDKAKKEVEKQKKVSSS